MFTFNCKKKRSIYQDVCHFVKPDTSIVHVHILITYVMAFAKLNIPGKTEHITNHYTAYKYSYK